MLGKISPFYFILAFAFGIFYCYFTKPQPEVIVKFPSPQNAGKVIYKGSDDSCFKYDASKVACPFDKSLIKPQPVVTETKESPK